MSNSFSIIKANFERWTTAWNAGDLDGYLECYAPSDDTCWISGERMLKGIAAIRSVYKERFSTDSGMGHLTIVKLSPQILTSDDALVFGVWELQHEDGIYNGVFHAHLKVFSGEWLIITDHATMLK